MLIGFAGTERFEVSRQLGSGGMGTVYEAYDHDKGARVALKTLDRFDAAALARFKKEFRVVQEIDHPNLVKLDELVQADDAWFFTMELVDGVDFLRHVRGERGAVAEYASTEATRDFAERAARAEAPTEITPIADTMTNGLILPAARTGAPVGFDEQKLRAALSQLALGLVAFHRSGHIHRDIKPSNVLVTADHRVVILDFGLVTRVEATLQSTERHTVGTAAYMAPEQAAAQPLTVAADWYAVGVLLYEALTGSLPFYGTTLAMLMEKQRREPMPPSAHFPDVPADLDALCCDLLRTDPTKRPTGADVLERLGADVAGPRLQTAPPDSSTTFDTSFVGRGEELARLRKAFDACKSRPVVTIVRGESGLGKTELVRRFTTQLTSEVPAVLVLAGRCFERESVTYKGFEGISEALSVFLSRLPKPEAQALLPVRAGLLPRLFPALQRVELLARARRVREVLDPQESRRRMFGALRELLARIAERYPLVLVVDDLQWSDADGLNLLQEVLCHADSPALLLVATMRPGSDPNRDRALRIAEELSTEPVIDLGALPRDAAMTLASRLLPRGSESELDAIVDEAGGHPLFLQELVRHSEMHGGGQVASLEETLWARISQLPPGPRRLLEIVSVAGNPIEQGVAASAAEVDYATFVKAASTLRVASFARSETSGRADTIVVYHDRVREVVLANLDESTQEHHHERLATALEQAGAARTAPHLLVRHAAASGDRARAAEYAEAAAYHAVEVMAFDRAAELFQVALHHGQPSEEKRRSVRRSLADALVNAGRGPEAAQAYTLVAEGADAATRLECQRLAAEQWLSSGHLDEGLDAMAELLTQIGVPLPKTSRRALVSLLSSRARLRLRGRRWKERDPSEVSAAALTRIDVFKAASNGLGAVDVALAADFQARGLLLALQTGERFRVCRALLSDSVFESFQGGVGRIERARRVAELAAPLVGKDPYLRAWQGATRVAMEYFCGRFHVAADLAPATEQMLQNLPGYAWELGSVRLFRLWSMLRLGALGEMALLLQDYLRDARRRGDLYTDTTMVRSCHILWLAKGDVGEARRVLEQANWTAPRERHHLQHWFAFRARAELAMYEGSGDLWSRYQGDFRALKKSLLLRNITVRCESRWLRGRLALLAAAEAGGARKPLGEAARIARSLEREGDPVATASALLLRSAVAAQRNDRARAVSLLGDAVARAEEAHLMLHAACARRRRGQLVGGVEGAALIAEADRWMAGEKIAEPVRMIEVIAPGFEEQSDR